MYLLGFARIDLLDQIAEPLRQGNPPGPGSSALATAQCLGQDGHRPTHLTPPFMQIG